ncbi:TIGR04283 family arsenosugar biosynthesis glycosyltransferase [Sanyastnella coralliicola]|uniref:TIGR04283 family arsenosugar biosynthesis glycosyltransferase n=1 Tax=Sanyastnella coralliicola TaxID=3069118 RepID=UPI0027B88B68|nr:TIGR04283 family arsenosugar biosynthesis glycosyltransferase [Longitalea sp. SCSIO 12813]
MPLPKISIVIPTLNEEKYIGVLLTHLEQSPAISNCEVIVVDAMSSDRTAQVVASFVNVKLISIENETQRSRAVQMNLGARAAQAPILWFVHADTLPPLTFFNDIHKAVESGHQLGGYAFDFQSARPLLKLNSMFTRFNKMVCRGGDQTVFILRDAFDRLEGFSESHCIMEEYDLFARAESISIHYHRLPGSVKVSPRKYKANSYLQVQRANYKAYKMWKEGVAPELIKERYFSLLKHPKD